jgi:hypothetical protein
MPYRRTVRIALLSGILGLVVAPGTVHAEKYAFLVGVKIYRPEELRNLECTENDITDLAEVLKASGYRTENIRLLTQAAGDKNPRFLPQTQNIRTELRELLRARVPGDSVIVALAGHGVQFKDNSERYFCPTDARLKDVSTLVALSEVYRELEQCPADFKLLLVDACRNDPFADVTRDAAQKRFESLSRPPARARSGGVAALYSCSAGEKAYEDKELGHGVFFHFVIEGLKGAAAPEGTTEILLPHLEGYVQQRVKDYVPGKFGAQQTPEMEGTTRGSVALVKLDGRRPSLSGGVRSLAALRTPRTLNGDTGNVSKLAYSPDGKRLVTINSQFAGNAILWDATSGEELTSFADMASEAAFTPDGQKLALTTNQGIKLVDAATGKIAHPLPNPLQGSKAVALSPDRKFWAVVGASERAVALWDSSTGRSQPLTDRQGPSAAIDKLAFAPDGQTLATGHRDGTLKLWDVAAGQARTLYRGGGDQGMTFLGFSPDSQTLAQVNWGHGQPDRFVKLWDVKSGKRRGSFDCGSPINGVTFVPQSKLLAVATLPVYVFNPGQPGTKAGPEAVAAKLWNVETRQEEGSLKLAPGVLHIFSLAFSADGKSLAAGVSEMPEGGSSAVSLVKLWNVSLSR